MVAFHMFCHHDAQRAREIARAPFATYFRALGEAAADWITGPGSKDYRDYDKAIDRMKSFTVESQIESGGAWIGTPSEIRSIMARALETIGPFEHASLQVNFADLDYAAARESLRLFAAEVMPAFGK
jgi:hypothetical protein